MKKTLFYLLCLVLVVNCAKKPLKFYEEETWLEDSLRLHNKLLEIYDHMGVTNSNFLQRMDSLQIHIKQKKLHQLMLRSYHIKCIYFVDKENREQYRNTISQAEQYYKKYPDSGTAGIFYFTKGKYLLIRGGNRTEGYKLLIKSTQLCENRNPAYYINNLTQLITIYKEAEDYKAAEDLALKIIETNKKVKYFNFFTNGYLRLAEIYNMQKEPDKQWEAIKKAKENQKDHNIENVLNYFANLSSYHFLKKRQDSALYYVNKEIALGNKQGLVDYMEPQILKAKIFENLNKKDSLLHTITLIKPMLKSFDDDYLRLSFALPILIKYTHGDEKIKYQQKLIEVLNNTGRQKLALQTAKYDFENKENELKKKVKEKDQQQKYSMIISFLVLTVLVFAAGIILINQKRKRKNLEAKNANLQLKILKTRFETTQEERNRISQELHDDLGANFTSMNLAYGLLKEKNPHVTSFKDIDVIMKNANAVHESLREIIWSFNLNNDNLQSFVAYCRKFAVEFLEPTGMHLHFYNECENEGQRFMDSHKRRRLYLIIKEIINNAVKHSGASTIKVRFAFSDQKLIVTLQDDGIGIPEEKAYGNGLSNIKKHIEVLKKTEMKVNSKEHGTQYTITTELNNHD